MRTISIGRLAAALALLLIAIQPVRSFAAEVPSVIALQSPAWIQREGYSQALRSDFQLRQGDLIRTGTRGRVYLRMPDNSVVKLGSATELRIEAMAVVTDAGGELFDGVLRVLRGAFRFTTRAVGRASTRRDVRVHVGTATAGIRGTDIWGSSDEQRDLIALLEGEIAVRAEGYPPQVMDQPLQTFVVPRGRAPLPIAPTDGATVRDQLMPQTELDPAQATMSDGPWAVVLASYAEEASAVELTQVMGLAGYPARIAETEVYGTRYYRVVVAGFPDRDQAQRYIDQFGSTFGTGDAWMWQTG
jgi:FecR-like protein/sporulation related protein